MSIDRGAVIMEQAESSDGSDGDDSSGDEPSDSQAGESTEQSDSQSDRGDSDSDSNRGSGSDTHRVAGPQTDRRSSVTLPPDVLRSLQQPRMQTVDALRLLVRDMERGCSYANAVRRVSSVRCGTGLSGR